MKELQILIEFAKDSDSEVIRRANGSNALVVPKSNELTGKAEVTRLGAHLANLKKVLTNQIKNN